MLVVFEGIDGCGKETQIKLLKEKFDCSIFKYPTQKYRILSDHLEKKVIVDPKALFLMFLADIADDQNNLRAELEKKPDKLVVLDRYVFSTVAYELDSIGYAGAKQIVGGVEYLKPDVVVLLDISSKISQERKTKQKKLDRYEEDASYLEKVRSNFLKLHGERFLTPNWHKIDASMDVESVHAEILKVIKH